MSHLSCLTAYKKRGTFNLPDIPGFHAHTNPTRFHAVRKRRHRNRSWFVF